MKTPTPEVTLSGLRSDEWVNPFGASAEELIAAALDEFGLMDKHTTINGANARHHFEDFTQKRSRFQEATRLGSILLKQGVIDQPQLDAALKAQYSSNIPLGELLIQLNICTLQEIEGALARQAEIREEFLQLELTERQRKSLWRRIIGFVTDDGREHLRD